uniref:AB hydrolase-1 domain-containing protein n=1 Tax=Tetranychus urticae TaxID=32264 RepID=T1JUT8_TETUR
MLMADIVDLGKYHKVEFTLVADLVIIFIQLLQKISKIPGDGRKGKSHIKHDETWNCCYNKVDFELEVIWENWRKQTLGVSGAVTFCVIIVTNALMAIVINCMLNKTCVKECEFVVLKLDVIKNFILRMNHSYLDERYEHQDRWVSATKNTKIPLQFIYGPADPVNPAPFEEMYHKLIPNQYFDKLDDNIGHYPHFEAPEEVVKRLNQFLKKKGF